MGQSKVRVSGKVWCEEYTVQIANHPSHKILLLGAFALAFGLFVISYVLIALATLH